MATSDVRIIGSCAVMISTLIDFVKKAAHSPMDKFRTILIQNEEPCQIRVAMKEPDLLSKGDRVAPPFKLNAQMTALSFMVSSMKRLNKITLWYQLLKSSYRRFNPFVPPLNPYLPNKTTQKN